MADNPTSDTTTSEDYLNVNRKAWNDRTSVHWDSDFYSNDRFIAGETSLKTVELGLLGDIEGKDILHLQCHFGQDTVSLARMGANATGIDLSDEAIKKAKELNSLCRTNCDFIEGDIYSAPQLIDKKFDLVFTSYGTIGWLPDIDRWAAVVSTMLKPGGRFIFVEFHPMVWMWDEAFEKIDYRYFNSGAIIESAEGTYAERDADIKRTEISWNHGLAEVMTALLKNGLQLEAFQEYDWSAYDCFEGLKEVEPSMYRVEKHGNKLPMMYSIVAIKK